MGDSNAGIQEHGKEVQEKHLNHTPQSIPTPPPSSAFPHKTHLLHPVAVPWSCLAPLGSGGAIAWVREPRSPLLNWFKLRRLLPLPHQTLPAQGPRPSHRASPFSFSSPCLTPLLLILLPSQSKYRYKGSLSLTLLLSFSLSLFLFRSFSLSRTLSLYCFILSYLSFTIFHLYFSAMYICACVVLYLSLLFSYLLYCIIFMTSLVLNSPFMKMYFSFVYFFRHK